MTKAVELRAETETPGPDDLFRTYNIDGTPISDEIDTTFIHPATVSVSAINPTSFVIGWLDNGQNDYTFAVYDINGNELVAATDVETSVIGNNKAQEVFSYQAATGIGLCNDNFVMAWATSDFEANWAAFQANGALWDGVC